MSDAGKAFWGWLETASEYELAQPGKVFKEGYNAARREMAKRLLSTIHVVDAKGRICFCRETYEALLKELEEE